MTKDLYEIRRSSGTYSEKPVCLEQLYNQLEYNGNFVYVDRFLHKKAKNYSLVHPQSVISIYNIVLGVTDRIVWMNGDAYEPVESEVESKETILYQCVEVEL